MKNLITPIIFIIIFCFSGCTDKHQLDKDQYQQLLSYRNKGLAYIEEEQYLDAAQQFKSFIDIAPFEASGYANLGWSYLQLPNKLDSAEMYLLEAEELSQRNSDIVFMVAKMYELSDRNKAAQERLHLIIDNTADHVLSLYQLSEFYRKPSAIQDLIKAEELLLQALQVLPSNLAAHLKVIDISIKNNHLEQALSLLERVRQILPAIPKEANTYLNESIRSLRNNDSSKSRVQSLIFHNLLKSTTYYKSGAQELRGGPGPIAGSPISGFINLQPPTFDNNDKTFRSVSFVDITNKSGLNGLDNIQVLINGDYDMDGDDDLFISMKKQDESSNQIILINQNGVFKEKEGRSGISHSGQDHFAISHDYDNDGYLDIMISSSFGVKLYKNNGLAEFVDMTQPSDLFINNPINKLGLFDFDLEGDLDIYVSRNGNNQLFRNNSDGTFTDISSVSDIILNEENTLDQVFGDFDDDGDVDMVVLNENSSVIYYDNLRQGYFKDLTKKSGIKHKGSPSSITTADYNNDGYLDIYICDLNGNHSLYKNKGNGTFVFDNQLNLNPELKDFSAKQAEFADLDNDGYLDLIIIGAPKGSMNNSGLLILRNDRLEGFSNVSNSLPPIKSAVDFILTMDVDSDGDLDLVVHHSDGSFLLRNDGGNINNHLKIRLAGLRAGSSKNNYFGIGSKLELKAGDLYQMRSVNKPVTHFGLGERNQGDVVRVLWSNGVPQNHLNPQKNQTIVETQILKGSCPYLFAWNGSKFDFVTDVLWPSALGMPLGIMAGEKLFAFPNSTDEYLKVPGEIVESRNGNYEFNFTTELWETPYLDNIKLMVIDHPDSVDIYINETFIPPPYPPFRIYSVSNKILPNNAIDNLGNDLRGALLLDDGQYANHITPSDYQGITEEHDMILDFGNLSNLDSIYLFMKGWLFPTDASINVNISQSSSTTLKFPNLQVVNQEGEWENVFNKIGFPKGKNKTMVFNLTDKFLSNDYRIRIQTNMQIYWDNIFISSDVNNKNIHTRELSPIYANLHFRGFSRTSRKNFSSPHIPDYYNTTSNQKWRDLTGNYTKYGDVLSLLLKSDNKYVIMNAGDEISLKFLESNLLKTPNRWSRDFLFYNDGWLKDGDLNTAEGQTATPLPFHGMLFYPPDKKDLHPKTKDHDEYMKNYNTRIITIDSFKNEIRNYTAKN